MEVNNTAERLRKAIAWCARSSKDYLAAREEMREAIRAHLSQYGGRGELLAIAERMKISQAGISNLKHGYGQPSIQRAKEVLEATK